MMINEKYSIITSGIAIVIVGVIVLFYSGILSENGIVLRDVGRVLPQIECDYENDQKAYLGAIEDASINICDCITNENFKNNCKKVTFDLNLYNQAISQYDSSICDEINDKSKKQACQTITTSGIKHLSEKDPQYLANIYSASHNEAAIGELEKLLVSDPDNIINLILLTLAYSEKGLKEQEQGRDQTPFVKKALATIEKAQKLEPENSEVYRAEGYVYEIKPDIISAIESYDKAVELDSNNILAYAGRGHANRLLGYLEDSIEDFLKAAELDRENKETFVYLNLCNLENSRGEIEKAIKNCKIVINQSNTDIVSQSESYQILGGIYIQNNDYSQAESYLLKAKSLTPNDPNLYLTVSKLNIYQENYEESENNTSKAIELSPTKASSFLALSQALYMQDKYQDAIIQAEKGLTLVQDDVSLLQSNKSAVKRDLFYSIAFCYRELGNLDKQKEYEEKAKNTFNNLNN